MNPHSGNGSNIYFRNLNIQTPQVYTVHTEVGVAREVTSMYIRVLE